MRRTQRTETSKYLEEKKSNEIPIVVASEIGVVLLLELFRIYNVITWKSKLYKVIVLCMKCIFLLV